MDFEYKNVLIMGSGRSGNSVKNILENLDVSFKIYDVNKNAVADYNHLNKKIISQFDLVVISPGISIYNKYVRLAKKLNITVVGELEFAYWFVNSNIIGITGTNGKTTTTNLINKIVSTTYSSEAYGNIGNPLSNGYFEENRYAVCEISSFQLESVYSFKPSISVFLNIAEDHIDRHRTFENYINAKLNIFKNNNEKSISIINFDDKLLVEKTKDIRGKKYYFSKFGMVNGVYVEEGVIYSALSGKEEKIVSLEEIDCQINILEDVLASILVAELLKIDREKTIEVIKTFEKNSHRLECVYEKNNIKYINDSKSTNIHSVIHAVNNISGDIVLLLGGKNKKLNFDKLFLENVDRIKYIIAFGECRKEILKCAKKYSFTNIIVCKKFVSAVEKACEMSVENSSVLLSPGCASFDEFKSYAERGVVFSKIVKDYNDVKS